jgi:leucyl/phenylalanyl-tRNA--protein transferase
MGRMFYGESMFHRATDASKIALVYLMQHLEKNGFGMMDCQMKTQHLASLGGREIPRKEFSRALSELVNLPQPPGKWMYSRNDATD